MFLTHLSASKSLIIRNNYLFRHVLFRNIKSIFAVHRNNEEFINNVQHNLNISAKPFTSLQQIETFREHLDLYGVNSLKMNSTVEVRPMSVHDVISEINNNVLFDKLSYTEVLEMYGCSPLNFIHDILKDNGRLPNFRNLIGSPTFNRNNKGIWTSSWKLLWPETKSFYGIGISKRDSHYSSLLAAALWLDKYKHSRIAREDHPRRQRRDKSRARSTNELLSNGLLQSQPTLSAIQKRLIHIRCSGNEPNSQENILLENAQMKENNVDVTTSYQRKEEFYLDNEDTRTIHNQFPSPKNVLHNIFDSVSTELKQKALKITPQYKKVKTNHQSHWMCTYNLKWPEDIQINAKAITKQEASQKAAVAALAWLKKNDRITKDAQPIIFGNREVKELRKNTISVLDVAPNTLAKMRDIERVYRDELVPHLVNNVQRQNRDNFDEVTSNDDVSDSEKIVLPREVRQRFLGVRQYVSKEKVKLPITDYKQHFINLLKENRVVIVKGEPGCGKSTRIPQYVLEAWAKESGLQGEPCRIAVTQPRRIAALSLAERVAKERDEMTGNIVGYQVRFKSNFQPSTGRILYCTTGILLRHFQSDPTLSSFTHIILDEAHERDVNTDLLMNLLRNALVTNSKIKIIVMSATIDTNMFKDYFKGAPVMEVPGFTYPVRQHFLNECRELDLGKTQKMCESDVPNVIVEDVVRVINFIHRRKKQGAILCFLPGWEDISKIQKLLPRSRDMITYCLHSRLQDAEQWKIFTQPPAGVRKVILATNIAETSVTIDDVVYVIDTGIHKEQRFDIEKGVVCIDNHWISKSSATQRKGRAGRVQPGESFHLYSDSKYASFNDFSLPEILRTSLTKIVLDCKVFSNNINALEFMSKLPCPPETNATLRAVEELKDLELLDDSENLTPLGRTLSNFQLEPKLAKAMVNAVVYKCVTPIVDIVTMFASDTGIFVTSLMDKEGVKNVKRQFCASSDHLAMMRLLEKWLEYAEEMDERLMERFCNETNLVPHKMRTMQILRKVHFDYLYNGLYEIMPISDEFSDNDELVKAVLFSGIGTVLKHRNWDIVKNRYKNNVNVLYTRNNQKATITMESVNFKRYKYPSDFLVYINETRSNIRRTTLVRECSLITPLAVLLFSNKKLEMRPLNKDSFSSNLQSNDQVELYLAGTNINFICDKLQAQEIVKCKESIMAGYQYFIYQLTKGAESNADVNRSWDNILNLVNDILTENNVN